MHKATSQRKTAPSFSLFIMNLLEKSQFLANLMNRTNAYELKYDVSCELYRMSTFYAFPSNVPVSERSLAQAGFYYTGVSDKVKCFSCGLMLDNWKSGDNALEKHKQLYPSCSFIQSLHCVSNLGSSSHSAFSPPVTNSLLQSSQSSSLAPSLEQVGYFSCLYSSFSVDPVTYRAVEDLPHLRPNLYNPEMSTEDARLRSYQAWPLTFLPPTELAKAGFYHLGPKDKVACFMCGGQLSNWEPKDNAMSEHRRHFPDCPFLETPTWEYSRLNVSNIGMQTYRARVKTFINWSPRIPVQPEQLANAGFYYVGGNDDVKCFCCDGGLRCWESGDDPWTEHAKWFPRCEYLLKIKGQEFVNQIQARFPHLLEQLLSTSEIPTDDVSSPIHVERGENRSEDAVMMNNHMVKAALEMGFSRSLVKQTVQSKILTSGENYNSINELVSDLLAAEDEKIEEEKERQAEDVQSDDLAVLRKNRMALIQCLTSGLPILDNLLSAKVINEAEYDIIKQKTQAVLQARELIDMILVKGNTAANVFRNTLKEHDPTLFKALFVEKTLKYTPSEDFSGLSMEEQLRRLQEERTCKVCMDKEVSIVFIPCGHLVVCKECAPSLRKCPICRGTIKGTVLTYLS
ncbi:baculoviral IAP repeat-containing protein 2 [Rhinatrema bivittatum]|uniref:baculoviral IAP repeat-containing protein 2 n=1 Tax=Rhinatrema bivittatum TaxID=194408 RepID=UPI001125EEDC|nr:baculoviral IAP repeat-containing protein 2 [Rhinatrema bivittatum]XP_029458276.1 baculoviral IAP repeat-containing protein 2 [Rhinatrema bivittatum]XP_029458277.1 baculoviral IAP repeat-containing protein 2 [Rhinatrema bivittatum]